MNDLNNYAISERKSPLVIMEKRHTKETKEEILRRAREGQRVSEVAKFYGISKMMVRTWPLLATQTA
jgi:transposase-like protein